MNARIRALFILSIFLGIAGPAYGTPQDFEGWLMASGLISLDSDRRYQLYIEGQPRQGDDWSRFATIQGRTGLVYNVDGALSFWGGYAWTPHFYDAQYHRDFRDEHRLWQQALYKHELLGLQWQHRFRQEQRFLERTNDVSNRSRYFVRASYGLTASKDFGLTSFDEVMYTINGVKNGPWSGYDRNRFFIGPYWVIDNARYEVGYLGEHLKRFGGDERWAHVILVSAAYSF